jgi:hypothetical protein
MERALRLLLCLAVMSARGTVCWGQSCPREQQTAAKFTVSSRRNHTGHWISQVGRVSRTKHTAYVTERMCGIIVVNFRLGIIVCLKFNYEFFPSSNRGILLKLGINIMILNVTSPLCFIIF